MGVHLFYVIGHRDNSKAIQKFQNVIKIVYLQGEQNYLNCKGNLTLILDKQVDVPGRKHCWDMCGSKLNLTKENIHKMKEIIPAKSVNIKWIINPITHRGGL